MANLSSTHSTPFVVFDKQQPLSPMRCEDYDVAVSAHKNLGATRLQYAVLPQRAYQQMLMHSSSSTDYIQLLEKNDISNKLYTGNSPNTDNDPSIISAPSNQQQPKEDSSIEAQWNKFIDEKCHGNLEDLEYEDFEGFFEKFEDDGDGPVSDYLNSRYGDNDLIGIRASQQNIATDENDKQNDVNANKVSVEIPTEISIDTFPRKERMNILKVLSGVNNGGAKSEAFIHEKTSLDGDWTRTKNCGACVDASIKRLTGQNMNAVAAPSAHMESQSAKQLQQYQQNPNEKLGISKGDAHLSGKNASELEKNIINNIDNKNDFLLIQVGVRQLDSGPGHTLIAIRSPGAKGEGSVLFYDPQKEQAQAAILLNNQYESFSAAVIDKVDTSIL